MMKFQVRTKKYESKAWKVVAEFNDYKEAMRYACRAEFAQRHTANEFDSWEVKNTITKERTTVA